MGTVVESHSLKIPDEKDKTRANSGDIIIAQMAEKATISKALFK